MFSSSIKQLLIVNNKKCIYQNKFLIVNNKKQKNKNDDVYKSLFQTVKPKPAKYVAYKIEADTWGIQ